MSVQKRHLLLLPLGEFQLHPGDLGKSLSRSLGTASISALPRKTEGIWAAEILDIVEWAGAGGRRDRSKTKQK